MKRSSYREPDSAFGQLMLRLRTRIGLTQAGLAKLLGISRHAVAEWEAGRSYPTAEHLKACIALGVRASAFTSGRRAEEIGALWHAAHQKVLLDEPWLQGLLSQQPSPRVEVAVEPIRGAEVVSTPQGRQVELSWTSPSPPRCPASPRAAGGPARRGGQTWAAC